jgi:hypothetical protein
MDALQKQGIDAGQYKTKNFARKLSSTRARKNSNNSGLAVTEEVEAAIADVRDDSTDASWVSVCYSNEQDCSSLKVLGSGPGGIAELEQSLPESDVAYGIVRKTFVHEKVGTVQADTVKFIFVFWRPEATPMKRKYIYHSVGRSWPLMFHKNVCLLIFMKHTWVRSKAK